MVHDWDAPPSRGATCRPSRATRWRSANVRIGVRQSRHSIAIALPVRLLPLGAVVSGDERSDASPASAFCSARASPLRPLSEMYGIGVGKSRRFCALSRMSAPVTDGRQALVWTQVGAGIGVRSADATR